MEINPDITMEDDDEHWMQLWTESRGRSTTEIESLEKELHVDPSNINIRVQLFFYYAWLQRMDKEAERQLSKHMLWLVKNKPSFCGIVGHRLAMTGLYFRPKTFGIIREAWLEQVSLAPLNGTIIGNAASFIAWADIETASDLFERAAELQPEQGWLGTFVIHCHRDLFSSPSLYHDKIRERIIDVGLRSLNSEPGGAPFMTCEYVSDAALSLGRLDVVRRCAELLRGMKWHPEFEQKSNVYLGLVALREHDRELAVQLMLVMKRGYGTHEITFRLARELFDAGERESIVQLINSYKGKIRAPMRNRWLKQIANDQAPDFQEYFR